MAALRVVKLQLINCIHKLMCGMVRPSMQDVIMGALLSFHLSRKDPNARDKMVYLHSTNYQVPLPSTSSLDFFFSLCSFHFKQQRSWMPDSKDGLTVF